MPEDRDERQGGEGAAGEIPAAEPDRPDGQEPAAAEPGAGEPESAEPESAGPGPVPSDGSEAIEDTPASAASPGAVDAPAGDELGAPEADGGPAGQAGPGPGPSAGFSAESSAEPESPSAAPAEGEAGAVAGDGNGYQIRLRNFEGPLDLLLFLIKKKKVEINDIPIAVITREYLAYLGALERMDIDREAEFLLMAAVLIYIKSQTLLPREQVLEPDVEPRPRSTDHLMPYDRIKAVVELLRDKEEEQSAIWQRSALTADLPDKDLDLVEVSLFDLAESFFALMKRKQAETAKVFKAREINMADKMAEIVEALKAQGALDFLDYLWAQETLEEALIAFFCLLELIKARAVMAVQEQLFHTIKVWLRKDAPEKDAS